MSQIDFYILKNKPAAARYTLLCKLIAKAYASSQAAFIKTTSEQESQIIDEMLWTFQDDSFIPHQISNKESNADILISHQELPEEIEKSICINLAHQPPTNHQRFKRILEIVPDDDNHRKICRDNFKAYRDAGDEINTHDL